MQTGLDVGIDVASKSVVAACARGSFAPCTVRNDLATLRKWLKRLPAGSRLGMEATGGYHQRLADAAHAAGHVVYVLNARDLKRYAEGVGRRGKTDRVDAEVIARFVAREHDRLHAYQPLSEAQRQLEQLLKRRGTLVAARVALELSWKNVAGIQAELTVLLKAHARLLQQVDALIGEAVASLPEVKARVERVRTIPGFGEVGSVTVAQALSHLPFSSADAFIAHTGLDPRPQDSGTRRGRRRLSKRGARRTAAGIAHLRHVGVRDQGLAAVLLGTAGEGLKRDRCLGRAFPQVGTDGVCHLQAGHRLRSATS